MKFIDLTGKKFGYLTVIEKAGRKNGKKIHWRCVCDCGNECVVSGSNLKCGNTKSCGCEKYNLNSKTQRDNSRNLYDLSGPYGIGYTHDGIEFYFDLEDYEKIKDFKWRLTQKGYIATNDGFGRNGKHLLFLHRLIMNAPIGYEIDHIKGRESKRDNRKCNLRIVDCCKNQMNSPLRKDNSCGVTGVYLDKHSNKWRAGIGANRRYINLGTFDEFEDAVKARREAEEKYHGEYSYKNSQSM